MSDWNGLPDQPERSGWHVIACGAPRAVWWDAESHYWWDRERRFYITIPEIKASSRSYTYFGAVYSASELAQMRKDERERAIVAVSKQEMKVDLGRYQDAFNLGIRMGITAIRTLTDKPLHE